MKRVLPVLFGALVMLTTAGVSVPANAASVSRSTTTTQTARGPKKRARRPGARRYNRRANMNRQRPVQRAGRARRPMARPGARRGGRRPVARPGQTQRLGRPYTRPRR